MAHWNRRTFLSLAGAPFALGAQAQAPSPSITTKRLNVLFIAIDDLRPALGCYGDRFAKTPNIDSLAAKGMLFERAYCQQAVCGPTRASLLTGLRPDTIRVWDLQTSFRDTVPNAITLPQYFKLNGYHCENIGKVFHGNDIMNDHRSWSVPERLHQVVKRDQYALPGNDDPSDEWKKFAATERADVPDNAYIDGKVADDACATLERLKDRPFFLGVGFTKPHLPFAAPAKYWDLYRREDVPMPIAPAAPEDAPPWALTRFDELRSYADVPDSEPISESKMREVIHGYYACASYTDANVGKVLRTLERLGLANNTVVCLWGDHGWHLGELDYWGKKSNFDVATRAPLILRTPDSRGAQRTDALVEFVDIYPTLAEACKLPRAEGLEGISMIPLLRAPKTEWKRAAFSQYPRPNPKRPGHNLMGYTMRTDRYRYTEWRDAATTVATELYDHSRDPNETSNVAASPSNSELLKELATQLRHGWRGALPPENARIA